MSSFTHPQVVSNLYKFISSAEHKRIYFEVFSKEILTGLKQHEVSKLCHSWTIPNCYKLFLFKATEI